MKQPGTGEEKPGLLVGYQHPNPLLSIVFTKLYLRQRGFLCCYKKLASIWLVSVSFFKRIAVCNDSR